MREVVSEAPAAPQAIPTPNPGRTMRVVIFLLFAVLSTAALAHAADAPAPEPQLPSISISGEMGETIAKEAAEVKDEIEHQARSLITRTYLGWDLDTIDYLSTWVLSLPLRVPELVRTLAEHGRLLGLAGSLVVLTFIVAVLYSLIGQDRVMRRVEAALEPVRGRFPGSAYPFAIATARIVAAAAIPLLLLGAYTLIKGAIAYRAPWFGLLGEMLLLWSAAALALRFLRETLTGGLFATTADHGRRIFRLTRLGVLYTAFCLALLHAADAYAFRPDVLRFLRFAVSVSVVCFFLLLMLNKHSLLSFFPDLPYRSYRRYLGLLERYYSALIGVSFVLALAWCFGFREFGSLVLVRIWSTIGALGLLAMVYHALRLGLNRWAERLPATAESARELVRTARSLLVYGSGLAATVVILNMLGLLGPIERLLSFPLVKVGNVALTFWTMIQAALVLVFFVYASRFLQAYLDYKIFPVLGVDSGLGYAINTIVRIASLALGCLLALDTLGVDLAFLLVFAGAIGVGVGLGLQTVAAHLIAGFIIIFGGKVRKGDWIKVEESLGMITDIHLMSTRVRTRGNVDYLIPNSSLLSSTIVNYSLSSPTVWISLPVGVSYETDPPRVEQILLAVAAAEPTVLRSEAPRVLFTQLADSSLNFELAVAIDVRLYSEALVKSNLYFAVFREFRKAGIEIPFPQREVRVRKVDDQGTLEGPETPAERQGA
jgi:small-conductance mechanosensitive channel